MLPDKFQEFLHKTQGENVDLESSLTGYVDFDELTNAIDYLERAHQFIKETKANPFAWKWATIALHGALYGFLIAKLDGGDPSRVTKPNNKKEKLMDLFYRKILAWFTRDVKERKPFPERKLIDFLEAFKRCQKQKWGQYLGSSPIQPTSQQSASIKYLHHECRNQFLHFNPITLAFGIEGLKATASDVLNVIEQVLSTSVIPGYGEHNKTLIQNCKAALQSTPEEK